MNSPSIVQKLWNYCNVLHDDGMSYGDYPGSSPGQANNKQLTYLLFFKMTDERTNTPYYQKRPESTKSNRLAICSTSITVT